MIEVFRTLFAPPRHLILIVAALWIGLAFAEKRSGRHGVSKETLNNLTFYGILGYIIGGRLLYALANLPSFVPSPLSIFSPNPDLFDSTAAALSAFLVGFVYGKRQNLSIWKALDALTPVFVSLVIGLHLSHLAAGTAFGSPTTLPWGIDLWNATRHPTQIYELAVSLIIFGLIWFRASDFPPGIYFLYFVTMTAGARLFLEAFRGDSALVFGDFRLAQVLAWVVLSMAFLLNERLQQSSKSG